MVLSVYCNVSACSYYHGLSSHCFTDHVYFLTSSLHTTYHLCFFLSAIHFSILLSIYQFALLHLGLLWSRSEEKPLVIANKTKQNKNKKQEKSAWEIFNGLCSLAIFAKHCILMFDRILNTLPPNSSIFIKKVCGYFVTLKITVRSALINIIPHPSLRLFKKIAFLLSIRVITYF